MTKKTLTVLFGFGVCAASLGQSATGRDSASGSSKVTLSFPSLHGFDAAEGAPSGGVLAVSKAAQRMSESKLRVAIINTNPGDALVVRRTVVSASEPGLVRTERGRESAQATPTETASFQRSGAFGWNRLEDRVRGSQILRAASGERAEPEAVVYELWHF